MKIIIKIVVIIGLWYGMCFYSEAYSLPELSVAYEGIVSVMEEKASPENVNKEIKDNQGRITSSENEIFMAGKNAVNILVKLNRDGTEDSEEDDFQPEDLTIELYQVKYDISEEREEGEENALWELIEEMQLEKVENAEEIGNEEIFKCSIENLKEGHYKIVIRGKDEESDRQLFVAGDDAIGTSCCMKKGYYESPLCTIDEETPIITEVSCKKDAVRTIGKRQYFQERPELRICIQEENFNKQNFSLEGKMFYSDGTILQKEWEQLKKQIRGLQWKAYYKNGKRINEASIDVNTEANYTLEFQSLDSTGHRSSSKRLELTYDYKKPEIIYTGLDNLTGSLIFEAEEGDDKIGTNALIFRKYHFFRYFCQGKIRVSIKAKDVVSGVEKLTYAFVSSDKNSGENYTSTRTVNGTNSSEIVASVSAKQKDFKGYLVVYAEDYGGNTGAEVKSKGMVSEAIQLHKESSNINIKMPTPFFSDTDKGISYYNKAVSIYASFEDKQSGLYKTSLYAGKNIGNIMMWDGENIAYKKQQRLILNPEDFSKSSAETPIVIQGQMEDNAGHIDKKEMNNKVVIDNIRPQITVTYDSDNKTNYYNVSRKATVTIKEQNFNLDAVKWDIQGSNKNYQIGEWKSTKEKHVCEVYFEEDGENYAINLSVTDYAGNKAEWKDKMQFTVDKTMPKVSAKIEGVVKNTGYFNTSQTVVFCIQDKNFDSDTVEYDIKAANGKEKVHIESPTKYIKKGEKYYSSLRLEQEAKYHIVMKCTDKAGNESESVEVKEFVIDTTVPKVIIKGIENGGIYEEGTITPQIICKDKYLDIKSVKTRLYRANGSKVLKEEWNYKRTDNKNLSQIQWDNLDGGREKDGIYKLFIEASDKAGNKIKDNFNVVFRVNRWGADFILADSIKKEIDRYYLREAPKIILREQCVKPTESRVIILKDNEERTVLGEENIKKHIVTDKTSLRYGWSEKLYNIEKKNFAEEGDYQISFQADSQEKKIHFVVDKTPPSVNVGNLQDEIYEEEEHIFTVSVMDNYALKKLELYIDESGGIGKTKKVKKKVIRPEDLDENNTVREKLIKSKNKQTIRYVAWDKAGNMVDSEKTGDTKRCYVTMNKTLKGYYKHGSKAESLNETDKQGNTKRIEQLDRIGTRLMPAISAVGIILVGICTLWLVKRK